MLFRIEQSHKGKCLKLEELLRESFGTASLLEKCRRIHENSGTSCRSYERVLEAADDESTDCESSKPFREGCSLYFHVSVNKNVSLNKNPSVCELLKLCAPEEAEDRRIFRRFGSHRFLFVKVPPDLEGELEVQVRGQLLERPFVFCGRRYKFLWCKHTKTPQEYVMFAEKGVGIKSRIRVEQVRDWCIPMALNGSLTLASEIKRIKLSFSRTTPTVCLPEHSMLVEQDIRVKSNLMTDGCGRVSRDALELIHKSFLEKTGQEWEGVTPTSFQARIGGFKGMWVLDESLGDGIKVVSRESQEKFKTYMKCLGGDRRMDFEDKFYDALYDTVGVCSWDIGAHKGYLNTTLIQILEARGVPTEFFLDCASKIDFLKDLDDESKFYSHLRKRHCHIVNGRNTMANEVGVPRDDDLVFRMQSSGVNPCDPVFADKRQKLILQEVRTIREKVCD